MIETGRFKNIALEDSLCQMSNSGKIENEFLLLREYDVHSISEKKLHSTDGWNFVRTWQNKKELMYWLMLPCLFISTGRMLGEMMAEKKMKMYNQIAMWQTGQRLGYWVEENKLGTIAT